MRKILLIILILFLFPQTANLQTAVEEQLSVDFSTNFPEPKQFVSVKIESYQSNLDKAEIRWLVDGVLIKEGLGLKDFTFTAGEIGEEKILTIRIIKEDGSLLEKKYSIIPNEVDIYYEAETYVPPFFKGRPEFSPQSDVYLIAVPNLIDQNNKQIPDNLIVFEWKINGEVDDKNSGVGKSTYHYVSGLLPKPISASLTISAVNSDQRAKTSKLIEPIKPSVSVYEKNPAYGTIFEQTIKNDFVLNRDEIEVVAVPYYFSNNILQKGIFNWFLNGNKIDGFNKNVVVFRKIQDGQSQNQVKITVENNNDILQEAYGVFNLNFENSKNNFNF